jgi:hypothetical protein
VATPDEEMKSSALGQAVNKAGKTNAMQARLKALGAKRKPEAVMKIPSEMGQTNVMEWLELLGGIATFL